MSIVTSPVNRRIVWTPLGNVRRSTWQQERKLIQSLCQNCVTDPPKPWGNTAIQRGDVDAYRCCVKSLIGRALVGLDVRQHARRESISKRAPSTTRTSLHMLAGAPPTLATAAGASPL